MSKERRATDQDRAHFGAIAAAQAEDEEARIERAARMDPGEGILRGFELSVGAPWSDARLAELDAQAAGQLELARRRIALRGRVERRHAVLNATELLHTPFSPRPLAPPPWL